MFVNKKIPGKKLFWFQKSENCNVNKHLYHFSTFLVDFYCKKAHSQITLCAHQNIARTRVNLNSHALVPLSVWLIYTVQLLHVGSSKWSLLLVSASVKNEKIYLKNLKKSVRGDQGNSSKNLRPLKSEALGKYLKYLMGGPALDLCSQARRRAIIL